MKGKQVYCGMHRRKIDTSKNDVAQWVCQEGHSDAKTDLAVYLDRLTPDEMIAHLKARDERGVGPCGRGRQQKHLDWCRYLTEKKHENSLSKLSALTPFGHFEFLSHYVNEKNWPRAEADAEFWKRCDDKVNYKTRDFKGEARCDCGMPACCQGKFRIWMLKGESLQSAETISSANIMQGGLKEKKNPSVDWIAAVSQNLGSNLDSTASAAFDSLGGASAALLGAVAGSSTQVAV